jgi:hypothetical protein
LPWLVSVPQSRQGRSGISVTSRMRVGGGCPTVVGMDQQERALRAARRAQGWSTAWLVTLLIPFVLALVVFVIVLVWLL